MDNRELTLEIERAIATIPQEFSDDDFTHGWTVDKANSWRSFLTRLREQVATNAPLEEYGNYSMCRVLDERDGIVDGAVYMSLLTIGSEIHNRLGFEQEREAEDAELRRRLKNSPTDELRF